MKRLKTGLLFAGIAAVVAALIGSGLIAGCSRAPEEPAWFQSTASGDILDEDQIRTRISRTDSLFELYRMKREYILCGGDSREVMEVLDARRDQVAGEIEAFSAIPGKLDFLGWDIEKVATGKYRVSCYFVVTGKMERDWILKIIARVDDQHVSHLPPESQEAGQVRWQAFPKTTTWDVGEHQIISEFIELGPIPYEIFARFFAWPEDIYHEVFSYGWFADPDSAEQ